MFTITLVVVGTVVPEVIRLVTVVVVDGDDIGLVAVVDTVTWLANVDPPSLIGHPIISILIAISLFHSIGRILIHLTTVGQIIMLGTGVSVSVLALNI